MLRYVMPQTVTVVVDVVAWGVFHAATGYAAHRLGDERLAPRRLAAAPAGLRGATAGSTGAGSASTGGRTGCPRPAPCSTAGSASAQLPSADVAGLELFVRETRRAELGHWWAMACSPLFVLWNPPLPAALLMAYGVLVNLPFILIQRYNRFRTQAILERLSRRGSRS